jgi:GNAT superfamily N-acetyltransferase
MNRPRPIGSPHIEWLHSGEPEEQLDLKFVPPESLIYPHFPPLNDPPAPHPEMVNAGLSLRGMSRADMRFLQVLTVQTRWHEVAPIVDWTPDQKIAFLESQHGMQILHYLKAFPDGQFMIVEHLGRPIGRLVLHRTAQSVKIVDITLIPEARGRAIGTFLLISVQEDAKARGVPVSLDVERQNPAARLYGRLGFEAIQSGTTHVQMIWRPRHDAITT